MPYAKVAMPDWPRRMQAPLAAAYLGISINTFLRGVTAGKYPKPVEDGANRLYHREDLDAAADRIKNGGMAAPGPEKSAADTIRERLGRRNDVGEDGQRESHVRPASA